jgi:toxin ParE1/3/4
MKSIVWLSSALRNLQVIHAYYSAEGVPDQAKRVIQLIQKTSSQLKELPGLGRSGRVAGTRELVVPQASFLIVYRENATAVQILRILHSSQKWPTLE